jgi:hypothetical protein
MKIKTVIDYLLCWKSAYLNDVPEENKSFLKRNGEMHDSISGIYCAEFNTSCTATHLFDQLTKKQQKRLVEIMNEKYNTILDIDDLEMIYFDFKGVEHD